jgi:hypothetical protein
MSCINFKHPEILRMAEELNVSPAVLGAKVGVWQEKNNVEDRFPTSEEVLAYNEVNMSLKAVDILLSDKAKQVFDKGKKSNWDLNKTLTELQIPKDQKQLILDSGKTTIDNIVTDLLANYSYTVEINTAKYYNRNNENNSSFSVEEDIGMEGQSFGWTIVSNGELGNVSGLTDNSFKTKEEAEAYLKSTKKESLLNTKHYSNLTVPGGTNYTENEIATPAITPSIKGHARFATDNGIGWFRSDDKARIEEVRIGKAFDKGYLTEEEKEEYFAEGNSQRDLNEMLKTHKGIETSKAQTGITKTRRILEVQSDLFQKGRDKKSIVKPKYNNIGVREDEINHNNKTYILLPQGYFEDSDDNLVISSKLNDTNSSDIQLVRAKENNYLTIDDNLYEILESKSLQVKDRNNAENEIKPQNQFLQLLNKDNNWVNFFIKSIIQNSAKKGYEKVLFPSGDTAAKIEGHETVQGFIDTKEARIRILKESPSIYYRFLDKDGFTETQYLNIKYAEEYKKNHNKNWKVIDLTKENNIKIAQLEKEIEDAKAGKLKISSVAKFYEETVFNVLKKQGYNPVRITDEYGNSWYKVNIESKRDNSMIFMNRAKLKTLEGSKENKLDWTDSTEQLTTVKEEFVDYSKENAYVLFANKQGKITADEVLDNILNNFSDFSEIGLEFIQKAKNLISKSGVKIQFVNESVFSDKDVIMDFDASSNTIRISRTRLSEFDTQTVVSTFLHELAHSQTAEALLNPVTFEQQEFKLLIDKMFLKYKTQSNNSGSYGFKNTMEFVAELYSNPEFRKEVEALDKSFWNKFIDAVRRLFGFKKNNEYTKLINEITEKVESDQSEFKGIRNQVIFEKRTTSRNKAQTIEDKLQKTLNKAKDNLDNLLNQSKAYKRKNEEKGKAFEKHIQELIDEIEKVSLIDQWKGVSIYVKSMLNTINQLNDRLDKEDFTKENGLELIDSFRTYMSTYDLVEDVKDLVTSLTNEKIDEVGLEEISQLKAILKDTVGGHAILESRFNSKLSVILKTTINNIRYLPEIEDDWRKKLAVEYAKQGITGISKTEWVAQQMNNAYKDEIQEDLDNYVDNLLTGVGTDISAASALILDGINNNSRLVSIVMNFITQARNKIIEQTTEGDIKENKLFTALTNEKGKNASTKKLYGNIYDQDSAGNTTLKGEYSIKFKEKFDLLRNKVSSTLEERGRSSKEFKAVLVEYRKWLKENTVYKNKKRTPVAKWKNDLSKLTKVEKEILDYFIETTKLVDEQTYGIQSLIVDVKGATFYTLPAVTKSDLERVVDGNAKGLIKDKLKDIGSIRPDDIGYDKKNLNSKGEIVRYQRVHYRGKLSSDQQSLDLFTVNRLNRVNGLNYKEKNAIVLQVEAIKLIAKNKEYFLKNPGGKNIHNMYSTREKEGTQRGNKSNEFKMIDNMIEKNIYDILHITYGNVGPIDLNKAISITNGWVASVGLSLNAFSAGANILNGQAQIFLERIAGNHLTKGSVTKAHKMYTSDLGGIMKDFGNPIKTSFVNQVNQMFDTFGGFSVKQQEFIKNTIAKTVINSETLQFMHEGGEHYLQSIMVMATLESIKVMDSNNNYIGKDGNVTTKDKAASVLDMLSKDSTGLLKLSDKVVYSDRNLNSKINEGGKEQLLLFVKKKLFDTMGNYDSNLQPELYRHWYGKLVMLFRRYLIPQLVTRFRGVSTAFVSEENLEDGDIHFNDALRTTEEGSYVSALRFLRHGIYPALRKLKFDLLSTNWNELDDDKKAGIKKTVVELALTSALLPLIGLLAAGAAGDDDDKEWLFTIAFLARRLESELSQFRDPREATKITKSPIPSLRVIEQTLDILDYLLPWNITEVNDTYQSGKNKGELKIKVKAIKLIPIISKLEITSEELYKGLESKYGK